MIPVTIPKLRAPIVMVHGLLGFDRVEVGGYRLASYFGDIPYRLEAAGNRVLVPAVSPTGGIADRALQLKAFLTAQCASDAVHIIAHSLGGLDARCMVSRLGMADRVLSLTTLGTPHRGTAFADWGLFRLRRLVEPVFDLFDVPKQAFIDLSTQRCREFNEQAPDAPGVRYFSVAGQCDVSWFEAEWAWSHAIVTRAEGPNDGVVSVASATYGERTQLWDGDHLSLTNYPNPLRQARGTWVDRGPQYAGLIQQLADEGF